MAATRLDKVGDSSTTIYDVTFALGYLRKEFVYVYLQGSNYTQQLGYTWINSTQIELNTPLGAGVEFSIRRIVQRSNPINDYEAGAILREGNLDDSFLQHLMILEEIEDGYITLDTDFRVQSNIDMLGNKLVNVGLATESGDAVALGQADSRYVNVAGDQMLGNLGGIAAVAAEHFPVLSQVAEIVDERISAVTITRPEFLDYGLITELVDDSDDYGSL